MQESFAQVAIVDSIAKLLVGMLWAAETVRACAENLEQDAPLPSTVADFIEMQTTLLAQYALLAGMDPSPAHELGKAALDRTAPLTMLDEIAAPYLKFTNAAQGETVH